MTRASFWAALSAAGALFAALLLAPAAAAAGVRAGFRLCAETLWPSLLPFFVLSGLLTALGVPELLARPLGTPMGALFGLPGAAAAPLLLGLTGGYPIGAAAAAEMAARGILSREEAERALPVCNNTGPAFLVGAAGGVNGSARIGLALYACHILAALAVGVLLSAGHRRGGARPALPAQARAVHFSAALTGAVRGAADAALSLGGFVVFFSVLRALLDANGGLSALAGAIALRAGLPLQSVRAAIAGVLELGAGVSALRGAAPTPGNLALCSFLIGFGSLSVHCQTLAAASRAGLKTARHFAGRLLHGCLAALAAFLLFTLLRI